MKKYLIFLFSLLLICFGVVTISIREERKKFEFDYKKRMDHINKIVYDGCMSKDFKYQNNGEIKTKIDDVNNFLKKYNAYVSYSEFDEDFYYGYKDNNVIYGASLIKLVDALYIIDNNVDINTLLTLKNKYYRLVNKKYVKENLNDKMTVDNAIKYALSWSDNGTHLMLLDFIGQSKLRKYGLSLGAKNTLDGGDGFGFQSAKDTNIYLKKLYNLSLENDNAKKFIEYMINDDFCYLSVNNLKVAHKYGQYDNKFHDVGIVFDEHPYTISVLTTYGKSNYSQKINEISKKIYELHNLYWSEKEKYCEILKIKN